MLSCRFFLACNLLNLYSAANDFDNDGDLLNFFYL